MRVVVLENVNDVAEFGAKQIANQVMKQSSSVLGLATGSSPLPLYQCLVDMVESNTISLRDVVTFNLDEYLGLAPEHPQSYRSFMNRHLFERTDIDLANTNIPNGLADNTEQACLDYEQAIERAGGIDLQLLGIGNNGHIGFNEPSSSLASRTRVKTLSKETVEANRRFFKAGEFQPHLAITMGIGSIMEAKSILMIATGEAKTEAVKAAVEGPLSASCPASILQMHPNATVVLDRAAASQLTELEYYVYIEHERNRLAEAV